MSEKFPVNFKTYEMWENIVNQIKDPLVRLLLADMLVVLF